MKVRRGSQHYWGFTPSVMALWSFVALSSMVGCGADFTGAEAGAGGYSPGAGGLGGVEVVADETAADTEMSRIWIGDNGDNADGAQLVAPPSNAVACTLGSQCPTGYCVDGFCCDNKCDNKCMACSAAKKGSGVDGICGSIKYDTDPDNDCPYGGCDGKNMCKNYNGFSCTSSAQCLSNYCVDGFCCGNICMGACQACSTAKKGGGSNGVCGSIAVNTDPDNECNPGECTGSGACSAAQTPAANGTVCTSAAQCASGFCADGVCCDSWCLGTCQACSAAKKNQGVDGVCGAIANDKDPDEECWGGACNGQGVCKQYNGVPCIDKNQCLSGYCVDGFCCGNICNTMCRACSEARKGQGFDGVCGAIAAGKDPDNECNPGECGGAGVCNQPQTPQANGTTCVSGGQCASGYCIDGVCCNTACTGACQACTTAKKGSGANGTCGNIASETDPDSECGVGAKCGGNGTCKFYNGASCSAAASCFSNYCVDGVCCGNVCTSTCYACSAAKKGSGNNGACGPIAVNADPDNECALSCNGSGACIKAGNGSSCTAGSDCTSGFCVDGYCCNTACGGSCQACDVAGSVGTCSASCSACTGTIGLPDPPVSSSPVVGTGKSGDNVSLHSGNGALPQPTALSYATNGHVISAAIADFNTDGKPDVVVGSDTVSVMLGQGNGVLGPRVDYAGAYRSVAVADFNGDGKPDIAAGPSGLGVWLNQGNGTFGARVDYSTPTSDSSSVLAADFNGDGKPDLAVATYTYSMSSFPGGGTPSTNAVNVLLNLGNGTFGPAASLGFGGASNSLGKSTSNYWLAAADFNGDGSKDMMYAYLDGQAVVLLVNQGNGTFTQGPSYSFSYPYAVVTGDVNGDGLPDVVVGGGSPTYYVSVMVNQGNGNFAPKVDYVTGGGPFAITLVDLDGDGRLDLANTSRFDNYLNVRLNQGGGVFGPRFDYNTGGTNPVALMGADMNGDEKADLVFGHWGSDNVTVLLNQCLP